MRTHSSSHVSSQYLYDPGRGLVSDLCLHRELTETSALAEHRSIKLSTYGVMFMSTPHQGGNGVALGKLMVNVADFVTKFALEEYATPTVLGWSMVIISTGKGCVE
ncbi:Tetratricopeptide repeat-containing domain protein [Pyrenophora teres f. maculata]|nr:Tetratricopeptide repeat-containing domain protein [Pyrenophora teres f. maculata]